jgi:hypothetical protein
VLGKNLVFSGRTRKSRFPTANFQYYKSSAVYAF